MDKKTSNKIRKLYLGGMGCRKIEKETGINHVTVLRHLRKLGVTRSVDEVREIVRFEDHPFQNNDNGRNLDKVAFSTAIEWFLSKGYMVSLPVDQVQYDLVVESDDGLKKVQIKSTNQKSKYGVWVSEITKKEYRKEEPGKSAMWKRVAYTKDDTDFFFILTGDRTAYLIPIAAIEGNCSVSLNTKYQEFVVLGTGLEPARSESTDT